MKKILFSLFTILLVSVISISALADKNADIEPNGHPTTAQNIVIGETYTGTASPEENSSDDYNLGYYSDQSTDWYKFTPDFSGTVKVYMELNRPSVFPSVCDPTTEYVIYKNMEYLDSYRLRYSCSTIESRIISEDTPPELRDRIITVSKGETYYIMLDQGIWEHVTAYKHNGITYFATYRLTLTEESCSHVDTKTTIIEEATCTEEGLSEIECTHCHEKWSKSIAVKTHALPSDWTVIKEATCTEEGKEEKICPDCSKRFTQTIPLIQHSLPSEWTIVKETSCKESGLKEKICSACGKRLTEEIQKLSHTLPTEWTVTREAACNKEGEREKICSACNERITESINRLPHTLPDDWTVTKEPTCLKEGKKEKICLVCNESVQESIPKSNEHKANRNWKIVTQATCESNGTKVKSCSVCGITLEQETIQSLECIYEKEVIVREPTETRVGSAKKVCIYCGNAQSNGYYNIPKLICGEETTVSIKSNATCAKEGVLEHRCDYCNKLIKTTTIKKTGHDIPDSSWAITKEATMLEAGEKTGTCINCGAKEKETYYYTPPKLTKKQIEENAKSITFSDVKEGKWYVDVIKKSAAAKYMMGVSEKEFDPEGKITLAQAITVATRIYGTDKTENVEKFIQTSNYPKDTPWYQGYIDYAIKYSIIEKSEFSNYNEYATRRQTAKIFAKSMSSLSNERINKITTIPDVTKSDKYASEIYLLYEAGVLTGSDEKGTFYPDNTITRAESAAIIARLTKISDRYKK